MFFKKRAVVRVIYKSGVVQDFSCKAFSVKMSPVDNHVTSLQWEGAIPNPMCIGVNEIAAVWQLK